MQNDPIVQYNVSVIDHPLFAHVEPRLAGPLIAAVL